MSYAPVLQSALGQSPLVVSCLAAGAAALLPLRRALFAGIVVVAATVVVSFGQGLPPLATLCAFLVVLVLRRLQEDRRKGRRLLAEMAATHAAQREADVLNERARIARDIHDVLTHSLSALLLQLQAITALLRDDPADERALAMVARAVSVAREGLVETKRAVAALHGELPGIDDLRVLTEQFQDVTGVPCRLLVPAQPPRLGPEGLLAVHRTVQEALTNVGRHACAPREVTVTMTREGPDVVVSVADEGLPPRAEDRPSGHGLTGLRERAELAGGTLSATTTEDGFRVVLRLPEVGG